MSMRSMIPNNITVTEQLARMNKFAQTCEKMQHTRTRQQVLQELEIIYGIRAQLFKQNGHSRFVSPRIVDEVKYLFYVLKCM